MRSQNELTSGIPVALTIAGSDSGGGAGIQADLKTFSALGVFGTSAITAVTAQNTTAVTDIHSIPLATVSAQIEAVLDDFEVGAIKIGMLASAEIIATVADAIRDFPGPVVLDPVMVAKSGDLLIQQTAIDALRDTLIPMARVITPNLPEAATLLGLEPARTAGDAADQGEALLEQGANAVLMKGGHAKGAECIDQLITSEASFKLTVPRIDTRSTHGTGCTFSAAIAAYLARGDTLPDAVSKAHAYLQAAIAKADHLRVGHGHGPVHHFHAIWTD
ncbi:MAG: bifunctional hydroxymethylpyrimidine kinase/phosphomethylpyrimidine kinase [Gammaproteobacteria bacterium]|nr:bifunctional hydroxymethylpyrimidine kinase/phosphomethylpyrimidine kinase [Gammaproteobacteria bacterium]